MEWMERQHIERVWGLISGHTVKHAFGFSIIQNQKNKLGEIHRQKYVKFELIRLNYI
jgi:hypothetical protein